MRKPLFSTLVGSCSVNLAMPTSDKDYVHFIVPTLEELCLKKEAHAPQQVSDQQDDTYYDIRRFADLAKKPTITNLAIFFTDEMTFHGTGNFARDIALKALVESLFMLRHDIACSAPAKLYEACIGTYKHDRLNFEKHPGKFKCAANAYRDLDFILRFAKFEDAGNALHYENELSRSMILNIKKERLSYEETIEILDRMYELAIDKKEKFYAMPSYDTIFAEIDSIIQEIIRIASR